MERTQILKITPNDRSNLTDAELVASYAREALELGRYPLGAELARLADRAARVGARPAGHDAAQREMFGPGLARVADVPLIGQTRDERPRDVSHAPQVCTYRSEINGSGQLCHQPIAWADQGANSGWYHLDGEITDHAPVVAGY